MSATTALPTLLLVDDDLTALTVLPRALGGAGVEGSWVVAPSQKSALSLVEEHKPPVIILDLSLSPTEGVDAGFELLSSFRRYDPSSRIIVLTGHGGVAYGVKALSLGAANFIQKPADIFHLAALVRDGIAQCQIRRALEESRSTAYGEIERVLRGTSEAIVRVRSEVARAAAHRQPVFLKGETGTGKGVCAKAIHDHRVGNSGNFVRYQASFVSADMANSDLFGHAKGAFTGAIKDRIGLIERANHGTLFLDEVDELPIELQISLLGVLQEKKFRKVGLSEESESDFRLITATNRECGDAISSGKLRRDFYHRIAGCVIEIPPLRLRKGDITILAQFTLERVRAREPILVYDIAPRGLALLQAYDWPGNVRELESVIEAAAYRAHFDNRPEIEPSDISLPSHFLPQAGALTFHEKIEQYRRALVAEALSESEGNQVHAARALGIDRTSLRRILNR